MFNHATSIFPLFFVLLTATTLSAAEPVKLPAKKKVHLFLLLGQSNMAGRGKIEKEDLTPHPRVVMFNKANHWVPAVDPLHFDKAVAGVGIGKTFGTIIAEENPDITVGLIPCAVGGSPIDSWKPGVLYSGTKTHPWDDAMKRAKLALKDGELKGILWHQGESDSKPELAKNYDEKLHDLVVRLRKELDASDVPVLAGQLGQFEGNPWNDGKKQVDQAHRDLPTKVKRTAFVSADGLTDKGDKVHFDSASLRTFGKRYAEAYGKLIAKPRDK